MISGASPARVALGGRVEAKTTSEQERAGREVELPAWTTTAVAFEKKRWLFIINSANTNAEFSVSGWPSGAHAVSAFDGASVALPGDGPLSLTLPAYGVVALRFQASAN